MKNYDLLADYTNVRDTLLNDTLGRNEFLFRFVSLLQSVEGMNCSIALDAQWGAGKTFFVQQAKLVLDVLNPYIQKDSISGNLKSDVSEIEERIKLKGLEGQNPQLAVYYNAWENDNSDDPILSIIYSIAKSIPVDKELLEGKRNIREVVGSIFGLVHFQVSLPIKEASVTVDFDGQRVKDVIDALEKKKVFGQIEHDVKLKSEINEFLDSLLLEKAYRLVIFIDELDRCQPLFAVKLLERIKHYFGNTNLTFVFSTNLVELQNTIRSLYGEQFSASRYLDKFFDVTLKLPPIEAKDYFACLGVNPRSVWDTLKLRIAESLHLGLREINRFLKLTSIADGMLRKTNRAWHDEAYRHLMMDCLSPLLIALRMVDQQMYDSFVNGKDATPLVSLFENNENADRILGEWGLRSNDAADLRSNKSRLVPVYNAVFEVTSGNEETVQVGNLKIPKDTKQRLLEITSLLSEYARYDE